MRNLQMKGKPRPRATPALRRQLRDAKSRKTLVAKYNAVRAGLRQTLLGDSRRKPDFTQ